MFPEHINVGFMQIRTPHEILLRVVERGSGETRACGSGAVAAVAVGRQFYALKSPVSVNLPGGQLVVTWSHPEGELLLTGPAEFVYEGTLF
jgi:diaminopimelate epimerase